MMFDDPDFRFGKIYNYHVWVNGRPTINPSEYIQGFLVLIKMDT